MRTSPYLVHMTLAVLALSSLDRDHHPWVAGMLVLTAFLNSSYALIIAVSNWIK